MLAIVRLLSRIFCALPLAWALTLGRAFGLLWYYVLPIRRGVALRNVRAALGAKLPPREQRAVVRRCMQHLGMFGVESLRLPLLTPELSASLVERRGFEHLEAARAAGRGVVVVTAHLGNFDLLACAHAIRGVPLHVIYKHIHWKAAHDFWFHERRRCGVSVIEPRGSERHILKALRAGEVVAFIIDQHMPPHRGIVCSFFGRLASTTPAPILFAMKTGAVIVPAVIYRAGSEGQHVSECFPPIELEAPHADRHANVHHNTERLNRWLEAQVSRYPEQWLWQHRRWKVHERPEGWEVPAQLRPLLEVRR